jgi:CheY-like chemotaxis protein
MDFDTFSDLSDPGTILVAEDNDDDALLMRRVFGKSRILNPLQVVCNGRDVMSYLLGEGAYQDRETYPIPVMLFLDLKMPVMNGFDVLQWIKKHESFRHLVVVVLSSSRSDKDVLRASYLGANSYLVKPGDFEQLAELMIKTTEFWLKYDRIRALVI